MTPADGAPLEGFTLYDPEDPFEMHAGPFYWRTADGGGHQFVMLAEARHCNRQGILHGASMVTMIDLALTATAKDVLEDRYVTVSLNSQFVAAGNQGSAPEALRFGLVPALRRPYDAPASPIAPWHRPNLSV